MARTRPFLSSSATKPSRQPGGGTARRIKLVVAYDGTDFCGFAHQPHERTVHGALSDTVRAVCDEQVELIGASRTDSGAHAKGQVVHFDTTRRITLRNWIRAINDLAPPDLSVVSARAVAGDFHARFSATSRWYRYRIMTRTRDPLRARYVHQYGRPLDVASMHSAAQALVGEHDFLAFTQLIDPGEPTRRRVDSIQVRQVRDEVWIDVVASAYARGMMRRISGALLEIGRGHRDPSSLAVLLEQTEKGKVPWPVVLPAKGLCLMRVNYGGVPISQAR